MTYKIQILLEPINKLKLQDQKLTESKWRQLCPGMMGNENQLPGSGFLEGSVTFQAKNFNNCYCSVAQSCPTLWDSMDSSTPGLPASHHLLEFTQIDVIELMMPSNHLLLCHHLLLLPSIVLSIRVFLCQGVGSSHRKRWPEYLVTG